MNIFTRVLFLLLPLLLAAVPVYSQEEESGFKDKLWLEINGSAQFMKTSFGWDTEEYTEEDFFPVSLRVNAGLRHNFNDFWFVDVYLHTNLSQDFGHEEWNDVSWSNSFTWTPTTRLGYHVFDDENEKDRGFYLEEISFNFFAAYENVEDSPSNSKDSQPDGTYTENFRAGVNSYISAASKQKGDIQFWLEFWNELAYNDTGLSEEPNKDFYIFQTQPVLGMSWFIGRLAVQPYLQTYISYDFGSEYYNKMPWLNEVEYGPGLRLSLGKFIPIANASLYLFGEWVWVDYFDRVDPEEYEETADDDFRIGLQFRLPFGAIEDFIVLH